MVNGQFNTHIHNMVGFTLRRRITIEISLMNQFCEFRESQIISKRRDTPESPTNLEDEENYERVTASKRNTAHVRI